MKNKLHETKKRKARQYARNYQWKPKHPNIELFYSYDEEREKSYWDDFKTKMNGQFLMIYFEHPRHLYHEKCNDLAYDEVEKVYPWKFDDFGSSFVPTYEKVGNSRKKVSYWEQKIAEEKEDVRNLRWNLLKETEQRILNDVNNGIVINCSYKLEQLNWCRSLDICVNREILSEDDALKFVSDCRKMIKGDMRLNELNDGKMFYDANDWINENN